MTSRSLGVTPLPSAMYIPQNDDIYICGYEGEREMRLGVLTGMALALAASSAMAAGPNGTFRGTYTCSPGQGITGDTSTFIVDANNNVKLIQTVYPIPGGNVFPTGAFELQGRYNPGDRTYKFSSVTKLGNDGYWIPATLPNIHILSADGKTMKRIIVNFGCTQNAPYTRLRALTPTPPAAAPLVGRALKGQS